MRQFELGDAYGTPRNHAICEGPEVIARVTGHGYEGGWSPVSEANARLLAAAPELLAALKDLLGDGCDIHRGVCMRCGRDYLASESDFRTGENCDADDCPGVIARAAIAKAEGDK